MRGSTVSGASVGILLALSVAAAEPAPLWTVERTAAGDGTTLRLDLPRVRSLLARAPLEGTEAAAAPVELTLPMPDGRLLRFTAVESPVLEPALAAQFPEIRTYAGSQLGGAAIARFDLTPSGFHAFILGPEGTAFVEPLVEGGVRRYVSATRQASTAKSGPTCAGEDPGDLRLAQPEDASYALGTVTEREGERRIYGLLAGATGEFTQAHGGTVASALAAITTTINGVNAIFRRDIGVHLELLAESQSLIFTDGSNDMYVSGDRSCDWPPPSCLAPTDCLLTQNQCAADLLVGNANYDVSIVFDDATGGIATVASVCDSSVKARGAVGEDVGLTAHELGHMFGAHHSFNGTTGECAGNRFQARAVEPGSGTTIMSYVGICGSESGTENVDVVRDLEFHHSSFLDMLDFTTSGVGDSCPGYAFTGNYGPVIQGMTAGPYSIPKETPFALSVQAYDPNGDPVTYSWEQYDTGGASPPQEDDGTRPIFRTYPPTSDPERWFPERSTVLHRQNVPADVWFCGGSGSGMCIVGEKMPTTTRTMHFNVILRDGQDGVTVGYATVSSDAGSGPFKVTQPQDSESDFTWWTIGARREVKWDVANTDQPPVSCSSVRILLSVDNGTTWPYVLAAGTPNDGSEFVTLPFVSATINARIKVEAVGNVFFDVSPSFGLEELRVRNTNDSGQGSLRQAISDANSYPTGATIPFAIPGSGVRTIQVLTQLPRIVKPVGLDAWEIGGPDYTGPPLLELVGSGCSEVIPGVPCDGLVVESDNTNINGLIVRNFAGNGVVFRGAGAYASALQNSYIGTDATGTTAAGNGKSGILIDGGYGNPAYGNFVGQNVISGNQVGVTITGAGANGNAVVRNKIGTNAAGTARIPNLDDGVRIVGAPNSKIGEPGSGNVISGNGTLLNGFVDRYADAIDVSGAGASGTVIQGNTIGLDVTGSTGIFNTAGEINITGAPNTLIGGTAAGARNVIGDDGTVNFHAAHCVLVSGAGATGTVIQGNYLGTDATGTLDRGCRGAGVYVDGTPGVQIGGTTAAARNVISGNNDYGGVWAAAGATGTVIQGNYIGTDVTGMLALGNNPHGIVLRSGGNTIGGTTPGAGNVISANSQRGIDLFDLPASNNVIQGNLIGTNAAGTAALGNTTYGINITYSPNNLIGGTVSGARNVISGNGDRGIYISGASGIMSPGNVIQGNYIGTDATGNVGIGNTIGVELYYVADATVGGAAPGAGNVISAGRSGNTGVRIYSFGTATSGIVVQGNRIGTNAAGTAPLGNTGDGIWGSITGNASILGNVVAGSGLNGINLGQGSFMVKGNFVGTDVTGTLDLRNNWSGIYTTSPAACEIGGTGPGEGNVVAFSSASNTGTMFAGVRIEGGAAGQSIRGNRIISNTGLGIDLHWGGVTPNDTCDTDTGANGLQNFPVLTATNQSGASTHVQGTLNSTAGTIFTVDFYASPSCDGYGYGEGATWLGSTNVTTNGSCAGSFDLLLPVPSSGVLTATATDPSGNTSEFSACTVIAPSPVAEVLGVGWASKSELTWSAAAGATSYRVLRGDPASLADLLDVDIDSCTRFTGAALTTGPILTEDPAVAGLKYYWYLVVGTDGTDDGPFGSATTGPRIANASGTCP